jgi:atypical dual specificity phosphatase
VVRASGWRCTPDFDYPLSERWRSRSRSGCVTPYEAWASSRTNGAWIDPAGYVLVCAYPCWRSLARLQRLGVRRLVNLHQRRHAPQRLAAYSLIESHVPVPDFGAPTESQVAAALHAIHAAVMAEQRVAVHCGGGLGRSGTIAACYLVDLGQDWRAAVARVRAVRPGAIETHTQLASVAAHAKRKAALPRQIPSQPKAIA